MKKSRLLGAVLACASTFVSLSAALAAGPLDGIVGGGSNPWVVMNDRVIQVETSIVTILQQIETLIERITTVEGQVEANKNSISSLESQNSALLEMINENISDISGIHIKIAGLENELKATDAALFAEIDALELCIAMLKSYLDDDGDGTFDLESRLLQQIQYNTMLIEGLHAHLHDLIEDIEMNANIENQECPSGMIVSGINDGTLTCTSNVHGGLNTWSVGKTITVGRTESGNKFHDVSCLSYPDYVFDPEYTVVATGSGWNGISSSTNMVMSSQSFDSLWSWRFNRTSFTKDSVQLFVKCVRVRN